MSETILDTDSAPRVEIRAEANAHVIGWDRAQIQVSGEADTYALQQRDGIYTVAAGDDCTVRVPRAAQVRVERTRGGLRVDDIAQVDARAVGGNLTASRIGGLRVARVGGNLAAETSTLMPGDDATRVGGNAAITLSAEPLNGLELAAGGNVRCDLGNRRDATVRIVSGSGVRLMQLGTGGPRISLTAGGHVEVVDATGAHFGQPHAEGTDEQDQSGSPFPPVDLGGLDARLRLEIGRKLGRARDRIERHAQRAAERTRRDTAKAGRGFGSPFGWDPRPDPSAPATPRADQPAEPVSAEEQLVILRMVADKKITAEQAEQLLKAMEA